MRGLEQVPAGCSTTGSALVREAIVNESRMDRRIIWVRKKNEGGVNGIATADTHCTYIASLPYIYTIEVQHVLMNIMKQCSAGLPCKSYVTARDYESCLGRDFFGVATTHL
jgi:hypothetical protein